jgi:hypothetical protein
MAFSAFSSLEDVVTKYAITYRRQPFVIPAAGPPFSDGYLAELAYTLESVPFQRSEGFVCEALIYPTLRDISKHYRDHLTLLSHEAVAADADLRGELDYVVTKRSPLGPLVPGKPHLLVGEATRSDLDAGWGQALAGMMAARKLDGDGERVFHGISTTGRVWAFGKLEGTTFTEDPRPFGVEDVAQLAGALHFAFAACRDQVLATPGG